MKMTTEQFLSHLGIEVGKPFNVKGERMNGVYIIIYFEENNSYLGHYTVFDFNMNKYEDGYGNSLEVLLDCEITPLPKYTLTEDEKVLLTGMKVGYLIKRDDEEVHWKDNDGHCLAIFYQGVFSGLELNKHTPLDELRKCL